MNMEEMFKIQSDENDLKNDLACENVNQENVNQENVEQDNVKQDNVKQENVEQEKKLNDLYKIIDEFITDILNTFPEYLPIISRWWSHKLVNYSEEVKNFEIDNILKHCKNVFPERFFDILYKNSEIFNLNNSNKINTEFLPGIVFRQLWNSNISENTKEIIWKYLQLILFNIISDVNNDSDFKDTAKLFEFINEDELRQKLEETFENMSNLFGENLNNKENDDNESDENQDKKNKSDFNIPSAENINEHINSMLGGKLGKLAMELAEEASEELKEEFDDIDFDGNDGNINSMNSKKVFEKMFKNPTKMMNIIKNIGNKLDEKIKSGEMTESELMSEGAELLQKFKNTAGMGDFQKIFSQFMGGGKGNKVNINAMESKLNQNMKHAKMKERMRNKVETNRSKQEIEKIINTQQHQQTQQYQTQLSDDELIKIFRSGEKPKKTPRIPNQKQNKYKKNKK